MTARTIVQIPELPALTEEPEQPRPVPQEIRGELKEPGQSRPALQEIRGELKELKEPRKYNKKPFMRNALKNGIYAKFVTFAEDYEMLGMHEGDTLDELNLARLYLTKALQERDKATNSKEKLAWDFASH
jgi:hypothetical protein